ncbi:alpha-dextrin endo-1, 6-alpha-glucosidase [Clostridium botulinum C/D str. BKT12695]|nr:alpha-dextrin endo-1, 6-alpha-glucosidase [Clostridium botulinum C/D str. BKT12695]
MNKLYKDLYLKFEKEGYNIADKKSKGIYKQQKKDREELLNKIARVILTYTVIEEVLSVGDKDKKTLTKEFNSIINSIVTGEYKTEKEITKNILSTVAKDKYYKDAYTLNLGIDFNLKKLTDKQLKNIVNEKIKGEVWSNRLWKNKKQLEKQLKKEINNLINGKTTINKIEKNIKTKFNKNAYNTKRLVDNEVTRVQNSVNNVFAEEHGIEKQMFMATLDNRTTDICRSLDGKIFDINDNNKPSIPADTHVGCRSCLINMPSSDYKPKLRKNNITKEYVPFQTYDEWAEQQDID